MNASPLSKHPTYLELERLLQELKKSEPKVSGYEIHAFEKKSEQRLLFGTGLENGLDVSTARYDIFERSFSLQIYSRVAEDKIGLASGQIDVSGDLKTQIHGIFSASLTTQNPAWTLPGPSVPLHSGLKDGDTALIQDLRACTDRLVQQADAACRKEKGVHVNYAELFVNHTRHLHMLSTGFLLERETTDLYFEIAMEKLPLPNTQEVHNFTTSVDVAGLAVDSFIAKTAEEARSLGEVSLPETDSDVAILLDAETLGTLFHTLIYQLDLTPEYYRGPFIPEGQWVGTGEPAGDALTLSLDPHIDFMAESRLYTGEGIPTVAGTMVEKGRVVRRTKPHRIASYLGVTGDGLSGNVVVNAGKVSKEELLKLAPKVIEIRAFSSLLTNGDSLTYSSEIKFAVEHRLVNGKAVTRYLKGGVISGNIRENLSHIVFSRETERVSRVATSYHGAMGYVGPAWALIRKGVSLSGK